MTACSRWRCTPAIPETRGGPAGPRWSAESAYRPRLDPPWLIVSELTQGASLLPVCYDARNAEALAESLSAPSGPGPDQLS